MVKFGKQIIKIIISVGNEKVQFTLIFYLKQNKDVQRDLQRLEILLGEC